jgi:hypothetical protein
MKLYVGLDVSLATTAICLIDEHGPQVKMTCAASDPQAIDGTAAPCQAGSADRVGERTALEMADPSASNPRSACACLERPAVGESRQTGPNAALARPEDCPRLQATTIEAGKTHGSWRPS